MKKKTLLFTIGGSVLILLIAAISLIVDMYSVKLATGNGFAMSTTIDQQIYARKSLHPDKIISETMSSLKAFEDRFSLFREGSEIDEINRNAGVAYVNVSEETFALIKKAVSYCEMSEGLFDITIAPVTQAWGVNSDNPRVPSQEELDALKQLVNYEDILLDEENHAVMLRKKGQSIDLGAVAKGEACNVVRDLYRQNEVTAGLLSIGGNIMVTGKKPNGSDFVIGIRNPRGQPNDVIGTVRLTDEVLSTSGDYERVFVQDGKRYHHIMDPATAAPAETDLMSVTVVCEDGMYADFLSTWLFLLGRDEVLRRMESIDVGIVAIDKDYNIYVSPNLRDVFTPVEGNAYTYHLDF